MPPAHAEGEGRTAVVFAGLGRLFGEGSLPLCGWEGGDGGRQEGGGPRADS